MPKITETASNPSEAEKNIQEETRILPEKLTVEQDQQYYVTALETFEKGKTKIHDPDSLEAIVQTLVKNFEKEVSHCKNIDDIRTMDVENFRIYNNSGKSYDLQHLLKVGTYNVMLEGCPKELYDTECSFEESHKLFRGCFGKAFAWEVLEVFSGPPTVVFSWRHWGEYSGPYKDNEPTGKTVEMFGISVAKLTDDMKISSLQNYFDSYPFLASLDYKKCPHFNKKEIIIEK